MRQYLLARGNRARRTKASRNLEKKGARTGSENLLDSQVMPLLQTKQLRVNRAAFQVERVAILAFEDLCISVGNRKSGIVNCFSSSNQTILEAQHYPCTIL